MNNKLLIITIGIIISLIWGLYFDISIALVFCTFLTIMLIIVKKCKYIFTVVLFLISVLYGNVVSNKYKNTYKDVNECYIVGIVVDDPKEDMNSLKYTVKVISCDGKTMGYKGTKVMIKQKTYKGYKSNINYGSLIRIQNGVFKDAEESRNYKGFNYREVLRSKKIYGIINVNSKDVSVSKERKLNVYSLWINDLKKELNKKIYSFLSDDVANICVAILLGDKSNIDEEVINSFSDASLSHVLALSGMHINYIVTIVMYLFMFCGKRRENYITIIFIIFYSNLTGNSCSVMRAGIMVVYYMIAKLIHRRPDVYKGMCISCLIILINNPYAIKSMSFLLSFLATLSIILFQKKMQAIIFPNIKNKVLKFFKESISVSLSANILIMPILIISYHKVSFVFIISNVFISILLPLIIPLSIMCLIVSFVSLNLASFIGNFTEWLYVILLKGIDLFSGMKFLSFRIKRPLSVTVFFYYLFLYFEVLKIKNIKIELIRKAKKIMGIIYVLFVLIFYLNHVLNHNLDIHFVDVGQGDCAVIVTPKKQTIIVDGGGSEQSDYIGESVVVPYLLNRRIKKIDYMVISHFDTDHVGGLLTVMEELEVKNVIISKQGESSENYRRFKRIAKEKKIKVIVVSKGDKIQIEKDLYFTILWPNNGGLIPENVLNNNSVVCKLSYKRFSMLFTGDIEEIAEGKILQEYKNNLEVLKSNLLKVGHHGSKTSSTQDFLEAVQPKIALIGVGKDNKFGHPNDEVVERFNKLNIKIFRTDQMGEISAKVNKNGKIIIKKHL